MSVSEKVLERCTVENYDCVVGNIALFLAAHGIDPDQIAGAVLSCEPQRDASGKWTLEAVSRRQTRAFADVPGFSISKEDGRRLPPAGQGAVLVGNGIDMSWTPYYGNESLQHAFLCLPVEGADGYLAYDAYNTATRWGQASPRVVPEPDWTGLTITQTLLMTVPDGGDPPDVPARAFGPDERSVEGYLDDVRTGTHSLEDLAVDTWLMTRARAVNLTYAEKRRPDLAEECAAGRRAWAEASESVYIALRRKMRGRDYPRLYQDLVAGALQADADIIEKWGQTGGPR